MNTDCSPAETLFHEGSRSMVAGQSEAAEKAFSQALQLIPDFPEVLANLAWLQERNGNLAQAESNYRRAIKLAPETVQISLNFCVMLLNGKRFAEAESVYQEALQRVPESPAVWSNYGVLLACLKREDEAECCYRTALGIDENYAKARFNLAYILLRQGRFEEGWRCLEARDGYQRLETYFTCPRWRGESVAGKSLIIGFEAGHGDMIQFCRYAEVLKATGAEHLALVCHPGLKTLLAGMTALDQVYSFDDEIPAAGWDFWSPPMSLPFCCQTRLETIPARIPYLSVSPERCAKWQALLPSSGLRVGLVWKGNPNFENDQDRSLPSLATLAALASVAGISFVSLQKGAGEEEIRSSPEGFAIFPVGQMLNDFADTAAVISGLDLLISVDTAVAHLAGALGKPCWLLLPDYRTDWRWLTARADSPWYPQGMRLFRQPHGGGWAPVITEVVEALVCWKERRDASQPST